MGTMCCYSVILLALFLSPALCYPQFEPTEEMFPQLKESFVQEGIVGDEDDDGGVVDMERMWEMVQEDQPQEEPVDDQQFGEGDGRDELLMQQRKGICYTMLYVMAFTSGKRDAGSKSLPYLFLDLYTHRNGYVRIPDNPGKDMLKNKGDLWKIPISSVSKLGKKCIKKEEINKIVIHNGGNNGWLIESVVTVLRAGHYYTVLTANIGMNYGIDGDLNLKPSSHQITLTKVPYKCS